MEFGMSRTYVLHSAFCFPRRLTGIRSPCTICPVVLDGELAVPSRFNRAVPATRYSRVEFLLQDRST